MTAPTNSFTTYEAIGNREDLSDFIDMISPTRTPFISGIASETATSTKTEWQTDSLAAASGSNAQAEGDDAATDASSPTTRLFNYTQILDKVPRVTGTQRAMDSAGRGDEMDYQIMKRTKEIKRDLETSMLANNAQVGGSASVARELGGIETWIATNATVGGSGSVSSGDGTDTNTPGTLRAFTEVLLKEVVQSCYDSGGEPDTIMVGSFNKQVLSTFTGNADSRMNMSAGDKTLINAIDIYVSDFGTMQVIPNRFQVQTTALVLELDKFKKADLRPFGREDLAKTGDTDRVQLLMETTLKSSNEEASGAVYGLLAS